MQRFANILHNVLEVLHVKLEICGRAQLEAARRHKSDCRDIILSGSNAARSNATWRINVESTTTATYNSIASKYCYTYTPAVTANCWFNVFYKGPCRLMTIMTEKEIQHICWVCGLSVIVLGHKKQLSRSFISSKTTINHKQLIFYLCNRA